MDNKYVVTVEAVSVDVSMNPRGEEREINSVNCVENIDNSLVLFTKDIAANLKSEIFSYVLYLDKNNKVVDVVKYSILDDGNADEKYYYVLASIGGKSDFIKERFKKGDVIKFRVNGEISSVEEIEALGANKESIVIEGEDFFTSSENSILVKLSYKNLKKSEKYSVYINEEKHIGNVNELYINLNDGVNFFKVSLKNDNEEIDSKNLIIYKRKEIFEHKENILWFDQHPSALFLNSLEDIDNVLSKVKSLGFSGCALVVKGTEGYVSYKKNTLSNSPYVSEIQVESKKGVDPNRDLLQDFIDISRKYDLKVYAAINVMTEGNLMGNDCPLIDFHKDWEEVLQRPEDKGELLRIRESKSNNILLYINPANDDAIDFQLKRYEEIMMNYDVDGIVLDRCRYDNKYADFSNLTREKFEEYLKKYDKSISVWPDDVFKIQADGSLSEGSLYIDWWIFRASIINNIVEKVRNLVNKCSAIRGIDFSLSSYVGAWYDVIYENGLNWASKEFTYDDRLGFAESRIYKEGYESTSYLNKIDFLMIGTYYKTEKEINKYVTLGNILTNEEVPLIAGISLYDIDTNFDMDETYRSALNKCDGTMTFDAGKINFK